MPPAQRDDETTPGDSEATIDRRRFTIRYALVCVLVLGLGFLAAESLVPPLITDAYRGESLPFINDIIRGQNQHPVEFYLDQWRQFARNALAALAALGIVIYAGWWFRPAVTRFGERIFRGEPELPPPAVLWIAAWFGATAGLIEALHVTAWHLIERHPDRGFTWELVWMGPLASTLAFCLVGVLLLLAVRPMVRARGFLSPVALRVCVFAFGLLGAYAILDSPRLRLATYAVILLSLGIAASLYRLSRSRGRGTLRVMRRSTPALAAVLLACLASGFWTAPDRLERRRLAKLPPAAPGLPNVLLIILDTARAQSMSVYGYALPTTPNLERFSATGVTFDRAISTAPWTLPSHASMFTGRFHFEVSTDFGIPLDDTYPTLAEILGEDGYATAGFAANHYYTTRASGLSRGFARYEDYHVGWGRFFVSSWASRQLAERLLDLSDPRWRVGRKHAGENTDDFLRWLSTRPDRPFFVFVNYIDPHGPYTAPEPFQSMFVTPGMPPKLLGKPGPVTEAQMVGSRAAYDGTIANTDHHLGRLFEALEAADALRNTIVIVTSDHGELFGEHRIRGHAGSLYIPTLHVPLIISYPPLVPPATRLARPVSLRDIPATVLELVHGHADDRLPGHSLSRFWNAGSEDTAEESDETGWSEDTTPVLSEVNPSRIAEHWEPVYRGPMKSLQIGEFHYIRYGDGVEEVYDLSGDPGEQRDLSGEARVADLLETARTALDSIFPP